MMVARRRRNGLIAGFLSSVLLASSAYSSFAAFLAAPPPHHQTSCKSSSSTAILHARSRFQPSKRRRWMVLSSPNGSHHEKSDDTTTNNSYTEDDGYEEDEDSSSTSMLLNSRQRLRKRVLSLARNIVTTPIRTAKNVTPIMPKAVATVLKDATLNALDIAVDAVIDHDESVLQSEVSNAVGDVTTLIDEAFLPLEKTLQEMEMELAAARSSLKEAKQQSIAAMEAVQAAAIAQAEGAVQAVQAAEKAASRQVLADIYVAAQQGDKDDDYDDDGDTSRRTSLFSESQLAELAYEDVDYGTSEMAPPFLDESQCLVPGEPVIRVEKAPENSRRIFAGIDIPHSVNEVWELLTNYNHLQDVVPNLVVNDVLEEYNVDFDKTSVSYLPENSVNIPEEEQCRMLANQMKGAKLRQVGGARVAGIQFSARTTLEVREWPNGMPDFAHFNDEIYDGKSRKKRAKEFTKLKLTRYRFPRPFAVSKLPTRDISMQSIEDDDGEFRCYQGVWRMQPLVGCAPPGKQCMRLTYAVEVSPRAYLPVSLIEGRIVRDLCTNLLAIRDFLAEREQRDNNSKQTTVAA